MYLAEKIFVDCFSLILHFLALGVIIPASMLILECMAAMSWRNDPHGQDNRLLEEKWEQINVVVLVPAHNEALVIENTLQGILKEIKPQDRILVIADNCNDNTALVSRKMGVTVIERHQIDYQGKGYALEFGLRSLMNNPPDVVIVIDADCSIDPGSLKNISIKTLTTGRPVQAAYLLETSSQSSPKDLISSFAFKVKNLIRPLGLTNLGLPCLLTGSGMAFPWSVITLADLFNGNIVEDMKLGLDLAIAGYPPLFCQDSLILSKLPSTSASAKEQRTRWEHGHLQIMHEYILKLFKVALTKFRPSLGILALDLCIPPLTLVIIFNILLLVIFIYSAVYLEMWLPLILGCLSMFLISVSIITVWFRFSRIDIPLSKLLVFPQYIIWKIPLYCKFIFQPQIIWNSTKRDITSIEKTT